MVLSYTIVIVVLLVLSLVSVFIIKHKKNNKDRHCDIEYSSYHHHLDSVDVDSSSLFTNRLITKRKEASYILVLDTETFEAIDDEDSGNICIEGKKHLPVSISWALLDKNLIILKEQVYILRQSGEMDTKAIDIHGISNVEMSKGVSPRTAIEELFCDIEKVSIIVAHNLSFHLSVIKNELDKLGITNISLEDKKYLCTMIWGAKNKVIEQRRSEDRYPSLRELFGQLYFSNPRININYTSKPLRDIRLVTACLRQIL